MAAPLWSGGGHSHGLLSPARSRASSYLFLHIVLQFCFLLCLYLLYHVSLSCMYWALLIGLHTGPFQHSLDPSANFSKKCLNKPHLFVQRWTSSLLLWAHIVLAPRPHWVLERSTSRAARREADLRHGGAQHVAWLPAVCHGPQAPRWDLYPALGSGQLVGWESWD